MEQMRFSNLKVFPEGIFHLNTAPVVENHDLTSLRCQRTEHGVEKHLETYGGNSGKRELDRRWKQKVFKNCTNPNKTLNFSCMKENAEHPQNVVVEI